VLAQRSVLVRPALADVVQQRGEKER
jgi:hypothetical protein